jgi:hypothetical protein
MPHVAPDLAPPRLLPSPPVALLDRLPRLLGAGTGVFSAARSPAVFPQADPASEPTPQVLAWDQAVAGGAPDCIVLDTIKNVRDPG